MDIGTWMQQGGALVILISTLIGAVLTIVAGSGRFGTYVKSKMVGSMESEMREFMDEHKGCKGNTEKRLNDIDADIKNIYRILELDNKDRKLLLNIADIHSDHIIYGNHMDEVKQWKAQLHKHILNRDA